MSSGRVAIRYAKSILEIAQEKGILEKVFDDMSQFSALCKENRDLALMLKSPIIPHRKKASILSQIFKGKMQGMTLDAFDIIAKKNRENLLEEIADAFIDMYNDLKGIVSVSVITSFKLDKSLRTGFEKLSAKVSGKQPILTEVVDPSILGGFVLKMQDTQIDQSVSGQLNELKLKFSKK
ncbi:MAG: ATP synthase F1 subunit delta [Bacteroidota bacterium]